MQVLQSQSHLQPEKLDFLFAKPFLRNKVPKKLTALHEFQQEVNTEIRLENELHIH